MRADDYKIVRFDKTSQTIEVYFYSVDFTWNIDLPIDGGAEDPEYLDRYIRGYFPHDMHTRQHTDMTDKANTLLESLVDEKPTDDRLIKHYANIIYSELRQSDWTQLQDADLSLDEIQQWTKYRHQLRNLLNGVDFHSLDNIMWPEKPTTQEIRINVN